MNLEIAKITLMLSVVDLPLLRGLLCLNPTLIDDDIVREPSSNCLSSTGEALYRLGAV